MAERSVAGPLRKMRKVRTIHSHKFPAGRDGGPFVAWLCQDGAGDLAWFSEAAIGPL
jgi:hypothetical protein